jgi:hypothetical protein
MSAQVVAFPGTSTPQQQGRRRVRRTLSPRELASEHAGSPDLPDYIRRAIVGLVELHRLDEDQAIFVADIISGLERDSRDEHHRTRR